MKNERSFPKGLVLLIIAIFVGLGVPVLADQTNCMVIGISGPQAAYPGDEIVYTFSVGGTGGCGYTWGSEDVFYDKTHLEFLSSDNSNFGIGKCNPLTGMCHQGHYYASGGGFLRVKVRSDTPPGTKVWVTQNVLWETVDDYEFSDASISTTILPANGVPEFPSITLPITLIIAFIGAVLLIKNTREN